MATNRGRAKLGPLAKSVVRMLVEHPGWVIVALHSQRHDGLNLPAHSAWVSDESEGREGGRYIMMVPPADFRELVRDAWLVRVEDCEISHTVEYADRRETSKTMASRYRPNRERLE